MQRFWIVNQVVRELHCALKLIQKHASDILSDHTHILKVTYCLTTLTFWKWHTVWPHSHSESDTLSDHTHILKVTYCLTTLTFWKLHIVWPHSFWKWHIADHTQLLSILENSTSLINFQSRKHIFTVHLQSETAAKPAENLSSLGSRIKPAVYRHSQELNLMRMEISCS